MALTFRAPFAQTTKISTAVVTTAGTVNNDTPTNTILIATAGSDGALLTKLTALPRATVTASSLYLFVSKDSGTTKRLVSSSLLEAHTVAITTAIPTTDFGYTETDTLRLEAGEELYVSTAVALADGIVMTAQTSDF